jgi:hypothetical protein
VITLLPALATKRYLLMESTVGGDRDVAALPVPSVGKDLDLGIPVGLCAVSNATGNNEPMVCCDHRVTGRCQQRNARPWIGRIFR